MSTNGGRWPAIVLLSLALVVSASVVSIAWLRNRQPVDLVQSGQEAYRLADWQSAYSLARERLKQSPGDHEALRLLARSSVRLGRDSSAMSLYHQLGSRDMRTDDLYLLGITLARTGNTKGSLDVWQQALSIDSDHPDTLYEMIRVHLQAERFDAAAAAAQRLARHSTWKTRADALSGWVEFRRGNSTKAIELWNCVLAIDAPVLGKTPTPLVTRKDLVRALLSVRRSAEARRQLQIVLADGPDPEASWLLSRAYLQAGARTAALAASQAASSFLEENPTLHEPAPWTGATSCARCHPEKYQSQQRSRHARTFHHGLELDDLRLPPAPFPDPKDSKIQHTLRRVGNRMEQETRTPSKVYQAVVDYAFGSGDRGKTLVGHDKNQRFFELRVSVYREKIAEPIWDLTSGHIIHPVSEEGYLGRYRSTDDVRRCFACHVTNPRAFLDEPQSESVDHAIGCERCHGPGGNHLLAVAAKLPDLAIARPSLASGGRIVQICAQCHSPKGMNVEPDDPMSIRFQGTTLTWSRCYTESRDKLDCVTCHDPHQDVVTEAAHYEAQCLVCHPGRESNEKAPTRSSRSRLDLTETPHAPVCPVNPAQGCISCHMPKVSNVVPHSSFTDHFIRVHDENSTATPMQSTK